MYEECDGSLQNTGQALNRGSKLFCSVCEERGATIGCCHRDCKFNYHLVCGVENGAAFKVYRLKKIRPFNVLEQFTTAFVFLGG